MTVGRASDADERGGGAPTDDDRHNSQRKKLNQLIAALWRWKQRVQCVRRNRVLHLFRAAPRYVRRTFFAIMHWRAIYKVVLRLLFDNEIIYCMTLSMNMKSGAEDDNEENNSNNNNNNNSSSIN